MADLTRAREAKRQLASRLVGVPGLGAVGLARRGDGYVIKVVCSDPTAAATVPTEVDGVPVVTEPGGPVRPLS